METRSFSYQEGQLVRKIIFYHGEGEWEQMEGKKGEPEIQQTAAQLQLPLQLCRTLEWLRSASGRYPSGHACPGPRPGSFWTSLKRETPPPPWATCPGAWSPSLTTKTRKRNVSSCLALSSMSLSLSHWGAQTGHSSPGMSSTVMSKEGSPPGPGDNAPSMAQGTVHLFGAHQVPQSLSWLPTGCPPECPGLVPPLTLIPGTGLCAPPCWAVQPGLVPLDSSTFLWHISHSSQACAQTPLGLPLPLHPHHWWRCNTTWGSQTGKPKCQNPPKDLQTQQLTQTRTRWRV